MDAPVASHLIHAGRQLFVYTGGKILEAITTNSATHYTDARGGADSTRVCQALMAGFSPSKIMEVHSKRTVKRTFDPGFTSGKTTSYASIRYAHSMILDFN